MSLFFNSLNLCKTFLNLSLFCRLHYKMCHICWDLFYFLLYIYAHLFELFLFYFERKLFIADFQCKPLIKIHVFIIFFFNVWERERSVICVPTAVSRNGFLCCLWKYSEYFSSVLFFALDKFFFYWYKLF